LKLRRCVKEARMAEMDAKKIAKQVEAGTAG